MFRLSTCIVYQVPNALNHFRLGITLKARGTSLDRNRVKRQIRESLRQLAPILGSYDYNVVIPASRKMAFPYPLTLGRSLREELRNALPSP